MARWLLCSLGFAPAVALVAAILVDEGPTGEPRASSHFFPVVLWLYDDFAWTCARNSVIFALVVSLGSLVLGVGLRCALDRVWPRGQRLFTRLDPGRRDDRAGFSRAWAQGLATRASELAAPA